MKKRIGLILSLSVLIQAFSGMSVLALDEIRIEAESYADSDVEVSIIPGGTYMTASCSNNPMLEYDVSITEEGIYGIYVNGANITDVSFEVYVDDTRLANLAKPVTCNDWSVYQSFKLSDVFLSAGEHRLKLKPTGSIAFDYIEIREAVLEDKNIIGADLYTEVSGNAETVEAGDIKAVKLSGEGNIKYSINAQNADVYTLRLNTACAADGSVVDVLLDGELQKTVEIKNSSSLDLSLNYMAANIYLLQGEHTLEFLVNGENEVVFRSFTLNKANIDEALAGKQTIQKSMIDYIPGGEGVGYHETTEGGDDNTMLPEYLPVDVTNMNGPKLYATEGEWYKYSVTVSENGLYDLSICAGSPFTISGSVSVDDGKNQVITIPPSDLGWGDFGVHKVITLELSAGEHTIKISCDTGAFHADYFELSKVVEDFELFAVVSDGMVVAGENKANRGTEVIELYFTDILDETSQLDIKLSDGTDVIPTEYEVEENIVKLTLYTSLDYNTEYLVSISGAVSAGGLAYNQDVPASFITGDENSDEGVGTFSQVTAQLEDNKLTAEGVVANDIGINMAGRGVWATLKNGSKTYTTDTVYTADGGKFKLEYIIPDGAPDGDYTVKVFTDYNIAGKSFTLNYVSEATMNTIIQEIAATTTWEEVYDVLRARYKALGIGLRADVEDRTHNIDDEFFCTHFIGKTYQNKKDFLNNYYTKLAFENFNQSETAAHAKKHLTNEAICEYLGVNYKKAALIVDNADALYAAVAALSSYTDEETLRDDINSLIDEYLVTEFNISKPLMSISNTSTYVGRKASTALNFIGELQNVLKITYKIECPTEAIAAATSVGLTSDGEAEVSVSGKTVTAVITPKTEVFAGNPLLNHTTTIGLAGTYIFIVNADVEYKTSTESVVLAADAVNVSVLVNENTQNGTTGGGGGGNRGSSNTGGFSAVVIPEPEKTEAKAEFSDLSGVEWAKESIEKLLADGIISMPEDKEFRPNDNVTREEFVKMAVVAFDLFDETATAEFTDTASGAWYAPYVASALKSGIVLGKDNGAFGIGENITREDMAAILSRILTGMVKTSYEQSEEFLDDELISAYAKDAVYQMKAFGIINGVGNNMFAPKDLATRAMAAKVIAVMMSEVTK